MSRRAGPRLSSTVQKLTIGWCETRQNSKRSDHALKRKLARALNVCLSTVSCGNCRQGRREGGSRGAREKKKKRVYGCRFTASGIGAGASVIHLNRTVYY